jgi:hypothetical protein
MKKTDLLIGVVIGIIAPVLGSFIFIEAFTPYHFIDGVAILKAQGMLGKIITLGAILNIAALFILVRLNRELMGRGVILATILLTIVTLFV